MSLSTSQYSSDCASSYETEVYEPYIHMMPSAWISNDDFIRWLEQTISVINRRTPMSTARNSSALPPIEVKQNSPLSKEHVYPQLSPTLCNSPTEKGPPTTTEQQSSNVMKTLQVIAAFFALMNSWGLLNSFGVFQAYYATKMHPAPSASQIGWIGSIQSFLLLVVSVLTGPLIDAGYVQYILASSTMLYATGLIGLSFSTQYYQLVLSQGIAVGLGAGTLYLPGAVIPPLYFGPKHRTTVLGIVASGSGVGGVVYPIMVKQLLPLIGFGWTVRAIACVVVPLNFFTTLVLRSYTRPEQKRKIFDFKMLKSVKYLILCASSFFAFAGLYIPVFYVEEYALQRTTISPNLASYLVAITMAGSLVGRIVPNIIAEKLKRPLSVLIAITIIAVVLAFAWSALDSAPAIGIVIFAILYGFVSGAFVSLMVPVVVAFTPDLRQLGTRLGMLLEFAAFGILGGNPIAGAILSNTGGYLGLQCFTGALLLLTLVLLLISLLWSRHL